MDSSLLSCKAIWFDKNRFPNSVQRVASRRVAAGFRLKFHAPTRRMAALRIVSHRLAQVAWE
jgi:hypothetical protein